ncbi:hypothetical protein ACEPAH_2024 [Sanghuangporus vaninii]
MAGSPRTEDELLALAKKQLFLPPTASSLLVPKDYLAELQRHIEIFPSDTNFNITRQPGTGFGILTCLETGCQGLRIPLTRSAKVSDGGKKNGIGGLVAYREHINNHGAHKSSRNARLQQMKNPAQRTLSSKSNSDSSRSGTPTSSQGSRLKLVSVVDRTGTPAVATLTNPIASGRQSSSDLNRFPDAITAGTATVPKKRPSDGIYGKAGEQTAPGFQTTNKKSRRAEVPRSIALGYVPRKGDGTMRSPLAPHDDNRSSTYPPTLHSFSATTVPFPPSSPSSSESSMLSDPLGADRMQPGGTLFRIAEEMNKLREALDNSIPPIASSSTLQYPPMPTPLQSQMAGDTLYRMMEKNSNITNAFNGHEFGDASMSDEDSNEDIYGFGRSINRDPTIQTAQLQEFFQIAGNAEQFDTNASVGDALKRLNLPNLSTKFPGLDIMLMPHQVIGVAWMLDKEQGPNKGGILSDEMGLGKTVQMIATIMANQSDDPAMKTTLIIAPLALLGQWKLEIEMKTNDGLSVHIYHGSEKAKSKKTLQKADVVLTTYGTLAQEWFDAEEFEKQLRLEAEGKKQKKKKDGFIESDSEDERAYKRKQRKKSGLLFTMMWHRIVLDEAQNVRNKRTRSSQAVAELEATYRWCLTGTPIINGLEDAYGPFRFLRLRPWDSREEFYDHIIRMSKKCPDLCSKRLQAIFATCLLRRRKDSMLDGKRLVELPPKDVQLVKLDFTPEEQEIYHAVETRSQMKFNRYLRAGTVLKNYAHVLVLLLRLRQVCTHTSLITEDEGIIVDDELDYMDEDKRDDVIKAHSELGREFVDRLKKKLRDIALERMAAEKKSVDAGVDEECPVCFGVLTDAIVTPCMHIFCRECINAYLVTPAAPGPDEGNLKADERTCPVCRGAISKKKLFSRAAFEPTDEELIGATETTNAETKDVKLTKEEEEYMPDVLSLLKFSGKSKERSNSSSKCKKPRKKRAKRVVLDSEDEDDDDEDDDLSDFIVHTDEDEEEKDERRRLKKRLGKRRASSAYLEESESEDTDDDDIVHGRKKSTADLAPIKTMSKLLPSTKMKHMMNNLETCAREHPDEKTMIISQWTQALDLVSNYLTRKGIKHVKFQGDMSRERRDKAVRIFMKKNDATVMLMSLKCGGVGLNLTRANRVISLDLGWSEAVENQAFDRVHRLGQTRPVFVERLVISNTVEDRVLALQEKKRNLADGSLGEGNGQKIGRLSVRELANLFGLDHYGNRLKEQ